MTVRKLHLETASDAPFNPVLKVAFATHSRLMIDEHFGHARTFLIYGVDYSGHQLLDAVEFTDELAQGHNRLPDKINLLKECDAVFCNACGASALRQLLAKQIFPIRVDEGVSISESLQQIGQELNQKPAGWMTRALKNEQRGDDSSSYLDSLLDEPW